MLCCLSALVLLVLVLGNGGCCCRCQQPTVLGAADLVFAIGSSSGLWPSRRELARLWWTPQMRGYAWLDARVEESEAGVGYPKSMVDDDVALQRLLAKAPSKNPEGVRLARIAAQTFRLERSSARPPKWIVVVDDDTVLCVQNLLRVLAARDPGDMHYVGSPSESHTQNVHFGHSMAFGGGGVALSRALMAALADHSRMEECIVRHKSLVGSDDRLHACVAELGVPLTLEPGFHQCDLKGDARGFLAAHPIAPFVSLHHVEVMEPILPGRTQMQALQLRSDAMKTDPAGFLQQSICHSQDKRLSVSVSMGYLVQLLPRMLSKDLLSRAELTFSPWKHTPRRWHMDIDTRMPGDPCSRGLLFYFHDIHSEVRNGSTVFISSYRRHRDEDEADFCWATRHLLPSGQLRRVEVESIPLTMDWYKVPRRQCCSITSMTPGLIKIRVGLHLDDTVCSLMPVIDRGSL